MFKWEVSVGCVVETRCARRIWPSDLSVEVTWKTSAQRGDIIKMKVNKMGWDSEGLIYPA
jgi:hypothetical protein